MKLSMREEGVRKSKNGLATSLGIPTFIFTLYSSTIFSNQKTWEIKNFRRNKLYNTKEFQRNNYQCTSSVYIIHKLKTALI
jgi:hypothetical protein